MAINFYNMKLTLKNYLKNEKKVGPKGIRGDRGPRGYIGNPDVCGNCKPYKIWYGGEVNDNGKIITDEKLKMGYCKFPFIFNNNLYNEPVKSNNGDEISDAKNNGWCATEVNDDLTMKKYGYCRDSDKNIINIKEIKNTYSEESKYITNNSGIIDLELISSVRSSIKCPDKYTKIDIDLNSNANGNYVYLCNKYGMGDIGITNIEIVSGDQNCPAGYKEEEVNLNDGVPKISEKDKLKLCSKKGNAKTKDSFIKNIKIVSDTSEFKKNNPNYKCLSNKIQNLNRGTDGDELYLCFTKQHTSPIIDAAFIWEEDNNLYFFIKDKYWKVTTKNEASGPFK